MTQRKQQILAIGFILTILFQLTVVGWEYLGSVWPLWFGKEITLKIEPVDPRSLFRGNYVHLNYDISGISKKIATTQFQEGDVAYIVLKQRKHAYAAVKMQKEKPTNGLFMRGRVTDVFSWTNEGTNYQMKYGIEAFFMPLKKARQEEKNRNKIRYASVYVLPNGRAAIADIVSP